MHYGMTLTAFSLFWAYSTYIHAQPQMTMTRYVLFFLFPTLQMADCRDPPCTLSPHQYARSLQ